MHRSLYATVLALAAGLIAWLLARRRPAASAEQSREIELLLAHVTKGFVIVDRAGNMGARHSAVMERWFGDAMKTGVRFWSLFRDDPRTASHLELAWQGLFEEFLPTEVALDQFPARLRHGAHTFRLDVHPIRSEAGVLDRAIVTLDDVTDALLREERDAVRSDLVTLCERAIADRRAVVDFMNEGDSLHRAIELGETLTELRRSVHTLKGVAAQAGAEHISQICHAIERGMTDREDGTPNPRDIATLSSRWLALTSRLRLLFSSAEPELHVTRAELDALLASIDALEPHALLARQVRRLRLEPLQIRLDRVKEGGRALGRRLGKDVEVTGSASGLRGDPAVWAPFWSAFHHVVRNALDHGFRERASGRLSVDVTRREEEVVVEVTDDGDGIDWDAVEKQARAAGLPAESAGDLEQALFADGLTTRDEVDELSGCGVGLSAVRVVTEQMGGRVSVVSRRGAGATFRFTFPITTLADARKGERSPPRRRHSISTRLRPARLAR